MQEGSVRSGKPSAPRAYTLAFCMVAFLVGCQAEEQNDSKACQRRIETHCGIRKVQIRVEGEGGPDGVGLRGSIARIYVSGDDLDDRDIAFLADLDCLRRVSSVALHGAKVSDAGVTHLRAFKSIRTLDLDGCENVTDASIDVFRELYDLEQLSLCQTGVAGRGIGGLATLRSLVHLDLILSRVDDTVVADLGKLRTLNVLDVRGTAITPRGVDTLTIRLPGTIVKGNTECKVEPVPDFKVE